MVERVLTSSLTEWIYTHTLCSRHKEAELRAPHHKVRANMFALNSSYESEESSECARFTPEQGTHPKSDAHRILQV